MSIESSILLALLMLAGNAFFVGAEFGLVSARRSSIEIEALKGALSAKITLKAMEHVSLMLAGAQFGVTVCSLIFGAVGEPLIAQLLEGPFINLGIAEILIRPTSVVIALITMVYMHVVIGEMVPKNLVLASPSKIALILVPPLVGFVKVFKPIITSLNFVANATLRLLNIQPKQELTSSFGRDEVSGFIKESLHEGMLSVKEEQLLSGSLRFDDMGIGSVVIALDKIVSAPNQSTPDDVEKLAIKTGFSRFPIQGIDSDFRGYVHLKDIIRISDDGYNKPLPAHVVRPLITIDSNLSLRQAMTAMQQSGAHLAKVIGHDGRMVGMIALEDLIEELIGEIRDDTRK